jgi:hypothetical protein
MPRAPQTPGAGASASAAGLAGGGAVAALLLFVLLVGVPAAWSRAVLLATRPCRPPYLALIDRPG